MQLTFNMRKYSSVEIVHEISSMAIVPLLLFQEGHLLVTSVVLVDSLGSLSLPRKCVSWLIEWLNVTIIRFPGCKPFKQQQFK